MSQFLRLLTESDKARSLAAVCAQVRQGMDDPRHFEVAPESFAAVPGRPFAYWVSEAVRAKFKLLPSFFSGSRVAQHGGSTKDDFRFLRSWLECSGNNERWFNFAKGGKYSPYYADVHLTVMWESNARELEAALLNKYPYLGQTADWVLHRECKYGEPGITWPRRPSGKASFSALPRGCIFSENGPSAFIESSTEDDLLAHLAIMNSVPFNTLTQLLFSRGGDGSGQTMTYEVGYVGSTPFPDIDNSQKRALVPKVRRAWALRRALYTIEETSRAFLLPATLRTRLGDVDPPEIEAELAKIQTEIDEIAFELYGFSATDRQAALGASSPVPDAKGALADDDAEEAELKIRPFDAALSWAVGVAFGRFDWRLATGERREPPEPDPFDPLPTKSPGMLPDGAESFHAHAGILVDEQGHAHDLVHLVEEVLARIEMAVPADVRRWLQRDFFAFHLQRYSKSRRKAPIYWPLATTSGSYTLWIYYPSVTSQTLYTAINDFIEPKLKQVSAEIAALKTASGQLSVAGGQKRALTTDHRSLNTAYDLELELSELRDTLLKLAPTYKPNHDDGVQISVAPLWPLFRHKPWQKVLKDTWGKLEKGDYDWAHLAMNYWPERAREKCKTDKSLAIAHGLEDLYIEPESAPKKTRGRTKKRDDA